MICAGDPLRVKSLVDTVAVQGGIPPRESTTVTVPREALIEPPREPAPKLTEVGTVIVSVSARTAIVAGGAARGPADAAAAAPRDSGATIDATSAKDARATGL